MTHWKSLRMFSPAAATVVVWAGGNPATAFFPPIPLTDPTPVVTAVAVPPTVSPPPPPAAVPPVAPPAYVPPPPVTVVSPPPPSPPPIPNGPQSVPNPPPAVPTPPPPPTWHCTCTCPPPSPPAGGQAAGTPEPATMVSGLIGLAVVGAARRRAKRGTAAG